MALSKTWFKLDGLVSVRVHSAKIEGVLADT